jgi:hypothetical protein
MKRIRPWIYFVSFLVFYGALSTKPELDDYFQYVFFAAIFVLSVICVWRWWNDPQDPRDVGFGMSRLPLPASWKRWIYDERKKE